MVKNRMLYQLFSRRNFFHFQLIHAGKGSVSSSSASLSSSCSSPRNPITRTISLTRTPSVFYTVSCSNPLKKGLTSLTKIPVFLTWADCEQSDGQRKINWTPCCSPWTSPTLPPAPPAPPARLYRCEPHSARRNRPHLLHQDVSVTATLHHSSWLTISGKRME